MPGFWSSGLRPLPSTGTGSCMMKGLLQLVSRRQKKAMVAQLNASYQRRVRGERPAWARVKENRLPHSAAASAQNSREPGCPAQNAVSL